MVVERPNAYELVSRGAIAPDPPETIDGCRESGISPASGQPPIRLDGGNGLNAQVTPLARGMQRESAASPLPRWCCLTTHILRYAINDSFQEKPHSTTLSQGVTGR